MRPVWWCVRAGLRQDWRGITTLAVITALMGSVVLAALAGALRTETAVARFVRYAGPTEGQVSADPATMDKVARLPDVAYTERGALMLVSPVSADGHPTSPPGHTVVITEALVTHPPQARAIIVAGRAAVLDRANEVMVNEAAARLLHVHVGSVIRFRGYRPDQLEQVMNGAVLSPRVPVNSVQVTGIIRTPADLADNPSAPADVSYIGEGTIYATLAFYGKYSAAVGYMAGVSFHLKDGQAGLPGFMAEVKRIAGDKAQVDLGSDDAAAAASAQRGTSLEALALLLFGVIVALVMLVVVGQSIARQAYAASSDFPGLRTMGTSPRQLLAVALAPGALVAAGGMTLAIPVAYALSPLTPIGLARRAEVSPGFSFNAAILLGGAAALALLLAARAALTAPRVARAAGRGQAAQSVRPGARAASRLARWGLSPAASAGIRMAFEPGRGRAAVPAFPAIAGMAAAIAAVLAAIVFGSSLTHLISDPVVTGWNWDVTVGNPHSGDINLQVVPRLRADGDVSAFTVTALGGTQLDGHDVDLVGMQAVTGQAVPPVLAGRLPRAAGEIALGGQDLRALHKRVGDSVVARGPRGPVTLRVVGQVVLSPEVVNEQVPLGRGAVMTYAGATAVSELPLPRNVFLVRLRNPASQAAIGHLKQLFPGTVLTSVPPPEVRNLSGVSGLPLALALLLALAGSATIAHTLITSVRYRRREVAILKASGFVARQVRSAVAWQATAIVSVGLLVGMPLGIVAGRWAWTLVAGQVAIAPVAVVSPLVLLAVPAVLLLANAIAVIPAQAAARTRPAVILRAE